MTVRARVRQRVSRLLEAVPEPLAEKARDGAPASVLELLRHRGVPEDVAHFVLRDNPVVLMRNVDSIIVQRLYWMGERGWEPELLPWWQFGCQRAESVLELGANIGYFTVQGALAGPRASYVAVEPHPLSARTLRENLELNRITTVQLVEAAAVDERDRASIELHVPARDHYAAPAGAFVARASETARPGALSAVRVAAVYAPDLFRGADLVKLDVEGQEHRLLKAAREEIVDRRPTLFVELLDRSLQLRGVLLDIATAAGYSCLVPTQEGLRLLAAGDLETVSLKDAFGTRDIILSVDPAFVGRAR